MVDEGEAGEEEQECWRKADDRAYPKRARELKLVSRV